MSIHTREYVPRHAYVSSGASLQDMYMLQRFGWVKYPADVKHISRKFIENGARDSHYFRMLFRYRRALARANLVEGRTVLIIPLTHRLRHAFRIAKRRVRQCVNHALCVVPSLWHTVRHPIRHIRHI